MKRRSIWEILMVVGIAAIGVVAAKGFPSSFGYFSVQSGASSGVANPISNAIVAGWSFDDGTGSAISPTSYVNGFTLTNNNTVLVTNLGTGSNAAYFISANSEYFSYAADARLARTGDMTISVAYFITGPTNATKVLFSKGSNNVAGTVATEQNMNFSGGGNISLTRGSGLAGGASVNTTNASPIVTNVWGHVTVVFTNNTGWAFYTNGVLSFTSSNTNMSFDSTGDFRIGRIHATGSTYFDGMVREFYIWREAKSSTQCSNIYRAFTNNAKYPAWGNTY